MADEYVIYETDAPEWSRRDTEHKFECQCGSERRVDKETECKQCGAWYRHDGDVMVQLAPPIGEE